MKGDIVTATIITCLRYLFCTKQIITDGVNDGYEDGAVQEHFQQGSGAYRHESFDRQAGGGDGYDKWDDEEEDWETQQHQQDQDGKYLVTFDQGAEHL